MAEEKNFKFRGKTLEELKVMSIKDFALLLPSNIRRKVTRGFTEQEEIFLKKIRSGDKNVKTHLRDIFVLPEMVGLKISIYNGKEFIQINIVEDMLGMRFGELVPTRKIAQHTGGGAKKSSIRK